MVVAIVIEVTTPKVEGNLGTQWENVKIGEN